MFGSKCASNQLILVERSQLIDYDYFKYFSLTHGYKVRFNEKSVVSNLTNQITHIYNTPV